ncbi:uncharacterized protein BXZ73DRAFT_73306 [Epithele typhae]|uniref:uncharacterized protein n=1 Tax=Epithele typhae TaxID=378194 RepID=UPI002008D5F9|nr:uncharacterized protein BXZ73DRAFT_73306 [Epithele typhae]KAH9945102.1 hypothetical protein BXZ73DRAFT_73306 [Epithele typhae]
MSVTVRKVSSPSEAEIQNYCEVLADSFNNQFFAGALMNDVSLQVPIHRAHVAAALTGEGEVWIAEMPEEGVVGVGVWFGPGFKFLSTDKQREAGWNELMAKLDDTCRDWWPKFLAEYDVLVESVLGAGVKLGAWHLQLIGIKQSCQKKGAGKALLDAVEAGARKEKVPTCLETMAGGGAAKMYEAVGYTMQGSGPITWVNGAQLPFGVFIKHTEKE